MMFYHPSNLDNNSGKKTKKIPADCDSDMSDSDSINVSSTSGSELSGAGSDTGTVQYHIVCVWYQTSTFNGL